MTLIHNIKIGDVFGRYTVIGPGTPADSGRRTLLCQCQCGTRKVIRPGALVSGSTVSCGCWRAEKAAITGRKLAKHGASRKGALWPEYNVIKCIVQRCENPKNPEYSNYGGRGIKVFPPWKDFSVFLDYLLSTIGRRPSRRHSLDRINNDGNYEPGNIRWALPKEQIANRRKVSVLSKFSTQELLDEIAKRSGERKSLSSSS